MAVNEMEYKIGDIIKCTVTGLQKYGVFVSINNNYTGLIHISEVSDEFVKDLTEYVSINDIIYAKIIEIDEENKKLKLSIKNMDYHLGRDNINKETNGFKILGEKLPEWVSDYIKNKETSDN
jgi:predicted RNA-binding protein with RPS1 domain